MKHGVLRRYDETVSTMGMLPEVGIGGERRFRGE